jgi:hypothetical protein
MTDSQRRMKGFFINIGHTQLVEFIIWCADRNYKVTRTSWAVYQRHLDDAKRESSDRDNYI